MPHFPPLLQSLPLAALLLAVVPAPSPAHSDTPRPPNILIAIADDWGAHAGAYGTRWIRTPAFDRVAREGLLFRHAYTPTAKCAPSRASLLTGRNPWQLKAAANHVPFFPPEFKTWPEALAEHGWFVGHTQKGWGPGVATNSLGQPRRLTGFAFNARRAPPPATGIAPADYAANFEDFLEAAPDDRPWCFWYGALEPHRGFQFGSGMAQGGKRLEDIDRVPGYWPDLPTVRHDLLDYAFEVEHFDRHLGRMLDLLAARGLLDTTLVLVTSDHGPPFPRLKGNTYEDANRVPLALRWPDGIPHPGRVLDDTVSFIDLAPTLLEVAGIPWDRSGLAPSPGRSLVGLFRSPRSGQVDPRRDHVLLGRERNDVGRPRDEGYPVRAILHDRMLYLRNFQPGRWPAGNPETGYLDCDGSPTKTLILESRRADPDDPHWALCFGHRPAEELYNLRDDPDCLHNLAGLPAHAATKAALEARLVEALRAQEDPRILGDGDIFDRYPYAQPAQAHFHERLLRGEDVRAPWVHPTDFEPLPAP
ncbi:MAG: sulfatase [Verrucomicrobiae bacterium]|nr:sulfatase [Verrucomicrobiae bacterium]